MDEKREMQKILNHSLSGLKENPFLAQRVIAQAKGEKPVVKKISASMILVIVILCLTLTAIAAGIIYNKRGIGYFISAEAKDIVLKQMREEFLEKELPEVIKKMKLLGIGLDEIKL